MIHAIIVDDEQNGREILQILIEKHCPGVVVVDAVETIDQAVLSISNHKPHLIFLDIELDNGTGFEILSHPKIITQNFKVIFTTAYEHYAIRAIKNNALDYLLKPIDITELKNAITKAVEEKNKTVKDLVDQLKMTMNKTPKLKLANRKGFELVDVDTIIYCRSEANYTRFYLNNRTVLTSKTLKTYQDFLEKHNFMRIHKSHMVNLNEIAKYLQGKGGQVVMSNNDVLDVSKDFKVLLMEKING